MKPISLDAREQKIVETASRYNVVWRGGAIRDLGDLVTGRDIAMQVGKETGRKILVYAVSDQLSAGAVVASYDHKRGWNNAVPL